MGILSEFRIVLYVSFWIAHMVRTLQRDGLGHKPWIDKSPTAMRDFYASRHVWEPTWGKGADRGMTVKSVKIWSEGKCTAK